MVRLVNGKIVDISKSLSILEGSLSPVNLGIKITLLVGKGLGPSPSVAAVQSNNALAASIPEPIKGVSPIGPSVPITKAGIPFIAFRLL